MPLNAEDSQILDAERDVSASRVNDRDQHDGVGGSNSQSPPEQEDSLAQQVTRASNRSSSASSSLRQSIEGRSLRGQVSDRSNAASRQRTARDDFEEQMERHPSAIERIETQRLQQQMTVGSSTVRSTVRSRKALPNFGAGKPYPPPLPEREEYVVEFDGHEDPLHPQNWPLKKKLFISSILVFDSFSATFCSSVFSNAGPAVGKEFNVGREVTTLGTSLFVLGYAFGPIMWAPLSELYGRRLPIIIAAFGFGIFNIAVATGKDIQTVLISRFFAGLFGSSPLVVVAAVFADICSNKVRGLAIATFSATVFMGPLMGPFIGGFITTSYLGWRWTAYIPAFMGFVACLGALLFQTESYPPVILVSKAAELRRGTKNWGIHAKQEEIEVDLLQLLTKNVSRPLRILFTEPIVLLVSIYMSFLYGLLYLFLTAYALVFQGVYGFSPGVAGLPYFGFILGEVIGFIAIFAVNPSYVRKLEANNDVPVPEWRLPVVMAGGISFTIGVFWFGWTGYTNSIHWIVPTLSGIASGFGIFSVFLQLLNYIVDSYLMFAASALAGNTFMRSLFAAVFPLFATYMFDGIGINYGMTLLGCVAAVLVPLPFIFYFMGRKIRAKSKFAPAADIEQDKRRTQDEESSGTVREKKQE